MGIRCTRGPSPRPGTLWKTSTVAQPNGVESLKRAPSESRKVPVPATAPEIRTFASAPGNPPLSHRARPHSKRVDTKPTYPSSAGRVGALITPIWNDILAFGLALDSLPNLW